MVALDLSDDDVIEAAGVNLAGKIVGRHSQARNGATGGKAAAAIVRFARDIARGLDRPLLGVGCATPGIVDDHGVVLTAAHVKWTDEPLAAKLTAAVMCRAMSPMMQTLQSSRSTARSRSRPRTCCWFASVPPCACGQIGCIEAIASGSAIERLWPTETGTSAGELYRAASTGDPTARRLWAGVVSGLSRAVLLLALTWDPEVVVLSGGVASLGNVLRDATAEQLAGDAQHSEFLGSLDLGARMRLIDPSVALGPIGAVRAAHAARPVLLP